MKPETMAALIRAGRMRGSVPHARYSWVVLSDPAGAFAARLRKVAQRLLIADVSVAPTKLADGTFPVIVKAERDVTPADVALIEDEILAIYEKLRMGFNPLAFSRLRLAAQARGIGPFQTEAVIRVMRRVDAEL